MLAVSLNVPAGGSIVAKLPVREVGVRRLIISAPYNGLDITYDGIIILRFNDYNGFYQVEFESYHGFPNSTHFAFINNSTENHTVCVLIDYVPNSSIVNDYFERDLE
jgi:hypothetical protein